MPLGKSAEKWDAFSYRCASWSCRYPTLTALAPEELVARMLFLLRQRRQDMFPADSLETELWGGVGGAPVPSYPTQRQGDVHWAFAEAWAWLEAQGLILRRLPVLLHVSPDATPTDAWLSSTIRHTAAEASRPIPGSPSMLPRQIELMFMEVLRKHMVGLSANEVGWFAALNDPVVGRALKFLHACPFQDWSV
ncbi:MAG: cupin domain-containing protein [Gemmataceae bacterium]